MKAYEVILQVTLTDWVNDIRKGKDVNVTEAAVREILSRNYGDMTNITCEVMDCVTHNNSTAKLANVCVAVTGEVTVTANAKSAMEARFIAIGKAVELKYNDNPEILDITPVSVRLVGNAKQPVIRTLTAVERDGLDLRLLTVCFEIPERNFDLLSAIKLAVRDYLQTEDGKKTAEYNSGYFNLADVVSSLPREFCEKHGFRIMDSALTDEDIDWDFEFNTADGE